MLAVLNDKKTVRYRGNNMFYLSSKYSPLRALYPSIDECLLLKYLEKDVRNGGLDIPIASYSCSSKSFNTI